MANTVLTPPHHYLNDGYGISSWLLTRDHKRIALLYLAAVTFFFFIGGMAYPSGHTANIVLVYGLAVYLLSRYYGVTRAEYVVLWSSVAALSVTMVVVSLSLNWHWFADLIAGLIVGGAVLELTVAADAAMPKSAFDEGLRPAFARALAVVRRTVESVLRRNPAA